MSTVATIVVTIGLMFCLTGCRDEPASSRLDSVPTSGGETFVYHYYSDRDRTVRFPKQHLAAISEEGIVFSDTASLTEILEAVAGLANAEKNRVYLGECSTEQMEMATDLLRLFDLQDAQVIVRLLPGHLELDDMLVERPPKATDTRGPDDFPNAPAGRVIGPGIQFQIAVLVTGLPSGLKVPDGVILVTDPDRLDRLASGPSVSGGGGDGSSDFDQRDD